MECEKKIVVTFKKIKLSVLETLLRTEKNQ